MTRDLAVFIGRFQPFHLGHMAIITRAFDAADRVLVLIGSSFEPRSLRNPWFFDEREAMIRACLSPGQNKRLICEPLIDIRYNDTLWASEVQRTVYQHQTDDASITLVGRENTTTGYTSMFPQWQNINIPHTEIMSGTAIRHHLFGGGDAGALAHAVPGPIATQLGHFMATASGTNLKKEHDFVQLYKKGWEAAPFAPTHVTVDAVVIQSGHVLLVKRGAQPGKGLFALPGGFIHHEETLVNAMIRKLKDETQIKVPVPALIGSIKNQTVFDAPFRSDRGRTITHAFHIELRGEETLPKIKSGGENSNCFWLPLGQLDSTTMYEDHYFIIQKMVGTI